MRPTDPIERYALTPRDDLDAPERHWTLADPTTGAVVATYEAPLRGTPYVRPEGGGTYRVEPYGRGWRLVARATWDDEPLAWYTGRLVRSGGELLVAPDRSYDVRSKPWRRLDLHVRDGDGRRLLEAHAVPRGRHRGADIAIALLRRPSFEADTELLVTFVGMLEILVFRSGRRLGDTTAFRSP
jgi:hypothetical protein